MRRHLLGLLACAAACGGSEPGGGAESSGGSSSSVTSISDTLASTTVESGSSGSASASSGSSVSTLLDETGSTAPSLDLPTRVSLEEREAWSLDVGVNDPDGDDVRVFATGLPPGARWIEHDHRLEFRPDFTQGGDAWTVEFLATDGVHEVEAQLDIAVEDTIQPPAPTVANTSPGDGFTWQFVSQTTDDFLDSPGYAGRSFDAIVARPDNIPEGTRLPVLITLHGFDSDPPMSGWSGEFRISPADPDNTYWWGYAESLPGAVEGEVLPYTQRRVLHLLEWVLRTNPAADPERVVIQGASMGGAGALTIGLMHARHVSAIDASIAQAIPRNHRPSRVAQLSGLWGAPQSLRSEGLDAWDRMDLTRVLETHSDVWLFVRHGKDDPIIHFGAAVSPSPLTRRSFYDAVQSSGVGHLVVWDEGAHGPADPVLGEQWWNGGWNPNFDDAAYTRRSLAVLGFSHASHDGDPGTGEGNGAQPWNDESGFAGALEVPGDTGWNGDLAGALNRHLRWDANELVDTIERFEVPLRAVDDEGGDPPNAGYPTIGDRFDGRLPTTVDVSLRRVQAFRTRADETVQWSFGDASGEATADAHGRLTIGSVPVTATWQTLVVERLE